MFVNDFALFEMFRQQEKELLREIELNRQLKEKRLAEKENSKKRMKKVDFLTNAFSRYWKRTKKQPARHRSTTGKPSMV